MMISHSHVAERSGMYRLLARLYRCEADEALLEQLNALTFPSAEGDLGRGWAMLGAWLKNRGGSAQEALAVDYAAAFLAAGSADGAGAIPCESVYTSPKKIYMQEAWEAVCAVYAEAGLGKADAFSDLPEDHLALELEYMALLTEREDTVGALRFLEAHLLNWVPAFAADIERFVREDFYKAVGLVTVGFLQGEQAFLSALAEGSIREAPSYSVRAERFADLLARLREHYRVFAPKRLAGRGPAGSDLICRYQEIASLSDIEYKIRSHFSPKEVFYPISQTMFYFSEDECTQKEPEDERDILLIARPCDLNAIRRLDNIFLHNGSPDLYYSRMREKLHLVLLECRESGDNCFCVSMGSNVAEDYEAALRIDDICALVEVRSEALLPYFSGEVPARFTPEFVTENRRSARIPVIRTREELEKVCKSGHWSVYDDTCIGCGGCNTVCPTCSCFDTVDIIYNEGSRNGERRRVWSACMLSDFTRTAGGGMARKTPGANMRFKVLHKVYDYNLRFGGEHMCVGCGRCIDRCPQKIDYLQAVNDLADRLEKEEL